MKIYQVILLTTASLLVVATLSALSLPNDFFSFLRIAVCGVSIYAAWQAKDSVIARVNLLMAAVLFNPLAPIDLPQLTWRIIDLVTAATFIRLAFNSIKWQNQR